MAIRVCRGPLTESVHRAHGVVVGLSAGREAEFGDPTWSAYWRSSMKPFQALPLVAAGAVDAFGFDEEDLALICASHHGTPLHVARVAAMLDRLQLDEEALECGPHPPFHELSAKRLYCDGLEPGRLHNNCSGKHTGMLALARHEGWPIDGYADDDHPVQRRIREGLSEWLDVDPAEATWAVDGCGVPTPFLTVRQMARAYAKLGRSERDDARAVVTAMTRHPEHVSGEGALSADLMRATGGRLVAKEGAEGVFCVAAPGDGWGAAVKVVDGNKRAVGPALLAMLASLDLLSESESEPLSNHARPPVYNTQGRRVGRTVVVAGPRLTSTASDRR